MADELRKTKRTAEQPSPPRRTPRPRSRSTSGLEYDLRKLFSASSMDDHSYYHYHPHDTESLEGNGDDSTIADTETEKSGDEQEEGRDGILNLRDTESRPSKLERLKSSRSIKDPNLVSLLDLVSGRTLGLVGPALSRFSRCDSPLDSFYSPTHERVRPPYLSSPILFTEALASTNAEHQPLPLLLAVT